MTRKIRIGIIGGGVAGCSAALFARDQFPDASISIFERGPRLGGRLLSVAHEGEMIELGGSFVHASNRLAIQISQRCGVQMVRCRAGGSVGVWNGDTLLLQLRRHAPVAALRQLSHYGRSVLTVLRLASGVLKRWDAMYSSYSFETCEAMLVRAGLASEAAVSFQDLLKARGVSARFAADVVSSVTRGIFMHDLEINGLAGLVGLIGAGLVGGRQYRARNGNAFFCEAMAAKSRAHVRLSTTVVGIEAASPIEPRSLAVLDARNGRNEFDAIVSAVPASLTLGGPAHGWIFKPHTTRGPIGVGIVCGRIRPEAFGLGASDSLPSLILSTSSTTSTVTTVRRLATSEAGRCVYKIQADGPIGIASLRSIFTNVQCLETTLWTESPDLGVRCADRSFRLYQGLYDASALERSMSTIESQLIGSRNALRLLARDYATH